jgi:hypothetical protein
MNLKESWKPIIENLAKPTEYLMSGGDLRLNIDEILLNKYGCRPFQDLMHLLLRHRQPQASQILLLNQIKG